MLGATSTLTNLLKHFSRFSLPSCKGFIRKGQFSRHINTSGYVNVRFKGIAPATTVAVGSSVSPGSQDILLQNLWSAKDSSEVLNSINRHHAIMNSTHVLQALKSLFNLQKSQSSRMSNGEVVSSKDFRKLCQVLKSQVRHLELDELIDVMKCLCYLGVPVNAQILSIILNLISKQVNDLSLQQITFLDFIMKDLKPTPLVKALKIALPIVFEANLRLKCDFDNVPQMCQLLLFSAKRKQMENSTDNLVEALLEKRDQLTLKDARDIVFALCDTRQYNDNYKLLLCHALDTITDSIDKLDFYEMESILTRLYIKHSDTSGSPSYYHEEFCNGCIRMVLEQNYSFEQCLWILKKIVKFNHCHLPMLAHIAAEAERQPWQLEQCGAAGLITFLSGLSVADYKPPNWDRIEPLVIKALQGLMDRSELPWLRIVLDLCVLDCWCKEFFNKIFDHGFLSSFLARDYNKLDRVQLCSLDQVAATLSPWAIKPRAPTDLLSQAIPLMGKHVTTFPLQAPLQHGLGGAQYVLTRLLTPLGHFLDHVVVMRKGGYPVAVNLTNTQEDHRLSTDDIQVPADSKMVAVLLVPSSMCAINNERVRGIFRLQVNSIEALGITVAPILQSVWNTLPDFERIPYLMRSIRERLPALDASEVTPS